MRSAARASKVLGRMLEDIAAQQRLAAARIVWVTRLAQIFWGMIEVAVPDSVPNMVWRCWVQLLYLSELLMVALGMLLLRPAVQQLGLTAFGVTATIHLTILWLGDQLFTGARRPFRWIKNALASLLLVLVVLGFIILGVALTRTADQAALWLGWLLIACAIAAGLFDLLENYRALAAINSQTQAIADAIR